MMSYILDNTYAFPPVFSSWNFLKFQSSSKFAKENENLEIRVGIISGEVADLNTINEYASIPSMEGLLTMLAGGMIEHVRNLSIGLNLYAEQLEEK